MLNGEKAFSWRRGKMKNKEWTLWKFFHNEI
jgi:hypothetical protein